MERPRVLIVGAGLAVLAVFRALRGAGLDPEVVDRATAWAVAGTGIYLPANGVRALRALGLEGAVAERGGRDRPPARARPAGAGAGRRGRARVLGPGRVVPGPAPGRPARRAARGGAGPPGHGRDRPGPGRGAGRGDLRRRPPGRLRPGRPAQLAVRGRLPGRAHRLVGAARPAVVVPDHPDRPGPGVRLRRRPHRARRAPPRPRRRPGAGAA